MSGLDWAIVGGVIFSVLLGVLRGLVREVVALLGWLVAIVLALRFGAEVGALLPMSGQWPTVRTGLGAVLIVLAVLLVSALLGWLLKKLMAAVNLSVMDRALGAGFGLARAGLVLMAVVLLTYNTALAQQSWWQQSLVLPRAEAVARWAAPHLPSALPTLQVDETKVPAAKLNTRSSSSQPPSSQPPTR